ncbi:CIC11C00000001701 [Sungouiella intermedia]|uniref:CIC11C00000001701 n=1 Tax=Sungouiella intermedia TaxID=45354 RepID=A0A1L0BNH4_9ASCO|nr:CIC11C00000001701 [[Candida] intermedia]
MNLSEATFIVPTTTPKADNKARFFNLELELPFAEHPTVGKCRALSEAGIIEPKYGKVVRECGVVTLEVTDTEPTIIRFKLLYAKSRDFSGQDIATVTEALDASNVIDAAVYDFGPICLTILLGSAEAVLQLATQDALLIEVLKHLQVSGFHVIGRHSHHKYEVRTFVPLVGVKEDPVCGSGSGATAASLRDSQNITGITGEPGYCIKQSWKHHY